VDLLPNNFYTFVSKNPKLLQEINSSQKYETSIQEEEQTPSTPAVNIKQIWGGGKSHLLFFKIWSPYSNLFMAPGRKHDKIMDSHQGPPYASFNDKQYGL
jgi:hypothetical protein